MRADLDHVLREGRLASLVAPGEDHRCHPVAPGSRSRPPAGKWMPRRGHVRVPAFAASAGCRRPAREHVLERPRFGEIGVILKRPLEIRPGRVRIALLDRDPGEAEQSTRMNGVEGEHALEGRSRGLHLASGDAEVAGEEVTGGAIGGSAKAFLDQIRRLADPALVPQPVGTPEQLGHRRGARGKDASQRPIEKRS